MQESFLFNNTITQNTAIDSDEIDKDRLLHGSCNHHATEVVRIGQFIDERPMCYNIRVGYNRACLLVQEKSNVKIDC